ncbi:MAG: HEAT repeat domain-containing protein [Limnoraphis robusta]|uniref:HEAT repeat domain-containing protein n=1 Tax=Limnoraphis robusta TaxID=1118279 RepID=UPI002B1FFF5F|nr:HEAT repeat domain-containing protein [Limnoraphis robusta]MEA5496697.1 HEAT repeat domain-containing protein [Limnoraphis robusta BA-68 BA1]
MSNSNTQSEDDAILLAQNETDALLQSVAEQLATDTFDATDEDLLKRLVECLGDTRGMTRLRCAETLGEIGKPATPVLLEALADHSNVVVRRAAAKTLTLIADPSAVPQLIHALLNDEDTVVKGSSVGALAQIGEAAVPPLLEILESPDIPESTKGHGAWALSFIGVKAKNYLSRAIASNSPAVRGAVVGVITKIAQDEPQPELFDLLVQSLADSDEDVRCEAAAALGNLSYQPAIGKLVELLDHSSPETRKSAALALMKIGDRSSLEPLETALSQESETQVTSILQLAISQLQKSSN